MFFSMLMTLTNFSISSPVRQQNRVAKKNQHPSSNRRDTRSFDVYDLSLGYDPEFELWTENTLNIVFPPLRAQPVEIGYDRVGYESPDFSNGLDYPDPYLRTGPEAKRMADFLYSKELFFGDIPHQRALLANQELRKQNGLSPNVLKSIRFYSPFTNGDL
ncbi:unnamed protein product [Acanthoscelides obtectus]|uniref:Uncharacterized protein n=1 Tax=Acanthoscelides obtectus TaxID=200917 RepID=A0A9P0LDQ6_ACAOB|nr:unnamed protein product [Acanthoscelides obtectus]CAK1620683.1 hypothetical protein AOBTE_LOCUS506 [Acanthoscelides obtectus]